MGHHTPRIPASCRRRQATILVLDKAGADNRRDEGEKAGSPLAGKGAQRSGDSVAGHVVRSISGGD